jgi:ElaB/YqjD/DUF883 family membrane-anchored ribosome-binding protein
MSIEDTKRLIEANLAAGKYIFSDVDLASESISYFLANLAAPHQLLPSNTAISRPDDSSLRVVASFADEWEVQAFAGVKLETIKLRNTKLTLVITSMENSLSPTLAIEATLGTYGAQEYNVSGSVHEDSWVLDLNVATANAPGIEDLASTVGVEQIGEGLGDLGLTGLAAARCSFGLNLTDNSVASISVEGTMAFGGVEIDVTCMFIPDLVIFGELKKSSPLKVKDFLHSLGKDVAGLPDLTVNEIGISVHPRTRDLSARVVIEEGERWPIVTLGTNSISLGSVCVDLTYNGETTGLKLQGVIQVGHIDFLLSAESSALGQGWQFSGAPVDAHEIAVGQLVAGLTELAGGITLPPVIAGLSIDGLYLQFDTQTKDFRIDCAVSMAIPISELSSDFAKAIPGDLEIDLKQVHLSFNIENPGFIASVEGTLKLFGVEFLASAEHPDAGAGWLFEGRAPEGEQINLKELINQLPGSLLVTAPENVPDIMLEKLGISFDNQTNTFHLQGESTTEASVQLGNVVHKIQTSAAVTIATDPVTDQRTISGFLKGDLTLGSAVFNVEFDLGAANILKGSWDSADGGAIGFSDLASEHGIDHSLQIPGGLDLGLSRAAFEFNLSQGRFLLSAESHSLGEAFFIASNANETWDFVFGIEAAISNIPGFPDLGVLKIEQASLLLSTVRDDNFKVPGLPGLSIPQAPAAGTGPATPSATGASSPRRTFPVLGASSMPLKPGVTFAALLDLENSSRDNVIVKNLKQAVGGSTLLIQAVIGDPISDTSFAAYPGGSLTLAGGGNSKVVLSNTLVQVLLNPFGVRIAGSVLVPVDHVTLDATGSMVITLEEMEAIFDVKGEVDGQPAALPAPFGLPGVRLDEIGIAVGMKFVPAGVDMSLQGKFNIINQRAGANEFTIVLELVEEVPNLLYLSTYFESLSVTDLIAAATATTISGVPDIINQIEARELSIYWSEMPGQVLPDGTLTKAGFGFNGLITVGTLSAHARLELSSVSGVSGDAELPPINFRDIVKISGNGKGVTIAQEKDDSGEWITVRKPSGLLSNGSRGETRDFQIIPPGGPTAILNSKQSPYIDITAKIELFNLLSEDIEIEVRNDGLSFRLDARIGDAARFDVDCALNKNGFSGSAEFDLDLKGSIGPIELVGADLGSIDLDVSFHAFLDISINGSGFTIEVKGSFVFDGHGLTMPGFTIDEDLNSLEQLPARILKQIGEKAEEIFAEAFEDIEQLLEDAEAEAKKVIGAIEDETGQIAAATDQEAQRIFDHATEVYHSVAADVAQAETAAVHLEDEAAQITAAAAKDAQLITGAAKDEAEKLGGEAKKLLDDADAEVGKIETAVAGEVRQLEAQAGKLVSDARDEATRIGTAVEHEAEAIVGEAVRVAGVIVDQAENIARNIEAEATKILDDIAEAARKAAEWVEHEAHEAWNAIKKY